MMHLFAEALLGSLLLSLLPPNLDTPVNPLPISCILPALQSAEVGEETEVQWSG